MAGRAAAVLGVGSAEDLGTPLLGTALGPTLGLDPTEGASGFEELGVVSGDDGEPGTAVGGGTETRHDPGYSALQ